MAAYVDGLNDILAGGEPIPPTEDEFEDLLRNHERFNGSGTPDTSLRQPHPV